MVKSILFWQPASSHFSWPLFFFSHWFLWLILLALTIFWLCRYAWWRLFNFWLLLFVSEIFEIIGKHFSPWPRPFYRQHTIPPAWLGHYSWGSLPSGHAIRSIIILYFLWQQSRLLFWLILPGVILVNYGRVYFGLHYPLDILVGSLLGVLLTVVGLPLLRRLFKQSC